MNCTAESVSERIVIVFSLQIEDSPPSRRAGSSYFICRLLKACGGELQSGVDRSRNAVGFIFHPNPILHTTGNGNLSKLETYGK